LTFIWIGGFKLIVPLVKDAYLRKFWLLRVSKFGLISCASEGDLVYNFSPEFDKIGKL